MLNVSKTISVSGVSVVEYEGRKVQAAVMNGSINQSGSFTTNHTIRDKAVYNACKDEVKQDFVEFENYVEELASTGNGGGVDE